MDETELTDASIDACRGIERVGVVFWSRREFGVVVPGFWSAVGSVVSWLVYRSDEAVLVDPGIGACRGTGRVRVVDPSEFGVTVPSICLEPPRPVGPS